MLIYSVISLLKLKRKLTGAVWLRCNIYLADSHLTPFVIDVIRPRIYLPSALSERERDYIILHERTHIRRLDHIVKLAAFLALSIHWFNPLVWVAFMCCMKDMEMSCDEAVMKKMGDGIGADYSASLLSLATGRKILAGAPLAFGEGNTKSRIKNVLHYKKPTFWIVAGSVLAGDINEFCVAINYDITTDSDSYLNSALGAQGKGT
jgi:beta-lactamase regulating signal transducer with metallopeptidase domain